MVDVASALQGAAQSESPKEPDSEYLRKLMSDHPSEVLPFPRNGADGKPVFQYRMCVLSQMELDGCLIDAERATREQFKDKKVPTHPELGAIRGDAWSEVFNNAKIVEILQRACRQVETKTKPDGKTYYDPLFVGTKQIRSLLTNDELAALFNAYNQVQFKYGPLWRLMEAEEIDAVVERLEGGLDNVPLSQLEPGQLIVLVASLAARNRALRTDTGLSGSPVESGTSETSESGEDD